MSARRLGLAVAVCSLLFAADCGSNEPAPTNLRGIEPLDAAAVALPQGDANSSLGLFVGVRTFTADAGIAEVPFAVDDAVDLAHLLALPKDLRHRLLLPERVDLALSGAPQKESSRQRLRELVAAGAKVREASRGAIRRWLEETPSRDPALVWVSFATHGRTVDGEELLLAADSRLDDLAATAVSKQALLQQVARRPAALRLVVLDACREASPASTLELAVEATSKGPLAVLQARVGGPLFDDNERGQGVFTAALLDGLGCRAATDALGRVTVAALASHANTRVAAWMKERLGLAAAERTGVEARLGGTAAEQPLVVCHECERVMQPARVSHEGPRLTAFAADGRPLWTHTAGGLVPQAEVADLDGDGSSEVVFGVSVGGEESGRLVVLNCKGEQVWSLDTSAPSPYARVGGGSSGKLVLVRLKTADFFATGRRQIVTLSHDAQAWFPCRLALWDFDGSALGSYWHPGHLWHLAVSPARPGGKKLLVVAGKNNDLGAGLPGGEHVDGVLLFDPANIRGHGPPHHSGLERGSELWYGFVLPKELNVEVVDFVDRDHDGTHEIAVSMNLGYFLYLDFDGCPVSLGRGDARKEDPKQVELRYGLVEGDTERCRERR